MLAYAGIAVNTTHMARVTNGFPTATLSALTEHGVTDREVAALIINTRTLALAERTLRYLAIDTQLNCHGHQNAK